MRAVLCGYYGMGNGGDEALLATLLQMLPESVTPVVLSGNPAQTRARYGVEACDRKATGQVFNALRSSQAFIFGGGSLIQDATSALSPVYYAGLMGMAQRLGLRTIAWGQGVGPLNRSWTRWLAQQVFVTCDGISVRDANSAQLLKDWDVNSLLAPDPVWALESLPETTILSLPEPRISISLRRHATLTPARLQCLIQALQTLQQERQASVVLVPFQPAQDLAIAQQIQQSLSGPNLIVERQDPRELKGIFKHIDFAISMRLHGLIMAAAEGCICSALSYDPKVNSLMEEVNLAGWDLEALPEDARQIHQGWEKHWQQGSSLSKNQCQSLRDRAFMHRDLLETILLAN